MLSHLLSSRLIQAGLAFFVIVVGGSLLYSWHDKRTTEKELAPHDRFLQGIQQKQNATRPIKAETVENANTGTLLAAPEESIATETETPTELPSDSESVDARETLVPDDMATAETPAADVPVSPYGFGPYPEVPQGYRAVQWPRSSAEHELMIRVGIKLWKQGIKTVGSSRDGRTGLIYPNIPGIVYIEWAQDLQPNGSVLQYASRYSGPPETVQAILNQSYNRESPFPGIITESDIPPGISVISYTEGGIDPYEFLEIKKE